jgi:hypothetical protein
VSRTFDDLVAEADSASVDGWDFSWLDGRATEERPSWGYQRLMGERLASASAALDIQTAGGEVLARAAKFPPTMAATESWPPNIAKATKLLHPRGVVIVADPDEPPLPFADDAFDLVTSRHPATVFELVEYFLGPQPEARTKGHPDNESAEARTAGLHVVDVRLERLRMEFFDVGAVIHFLRKVIWTVPGFTVNRYRERLRELHEQIEAEGSFVAYSSQVLIEARKLAEPDVGSPGPSRWRNPTGTPAGEPRTTKNSTSASAEYQKPWLRAKQSWAMQARRPLLQWRHRRPDGPTGPIPAELRP